MHANLSKFVPTINKYKFFEQAWGDAIRSKILTVFLPNLKWNTGHVDILVNNGQQQPGCEDKIKELVRSARKLVTLKKMKRKTPVAN